MTDPDLSRLVGELRIALADKRSRALLKKAELATLLDAAERGEAYRVANDGLANLCRTAASESATLRARVDSMSAVVREVADSVPGEHIAATLIVRAEKALNNGKE